MSSANPPIDPDAVCAECGHLKRAHSALMGCYTCENDDFCEKFVVQEEA